MKPKSLEIFIPGPAGRLEAKYYKNPKFGSPVAIVLHPHPQYGGTMNNKIVQQMYNIFLENGFSVIKVNFRGVGKSDGVFDNGQGELSDFDCALGLGMFLRGRGVSIAEVTDGLSNTLFVGERSSKSAKTATGTLPGVCTWVGALPAPEIFDGESAALFVLGHTGEPGDAHKPNSPTPHAEDFTSRHSGGVNFLFGDGSVRFISDKIESHVGYTNSCSGNVNTANFLYQNLFLFLCQLFQIMVFHGEK